MARERAATMAALAAVAALAMVAPILLLFFVAQRYFIQCIVVSGVEG